MASVDPNSLLAWERIGHILPVRQRIVFLELLDRPGATAQEIAIEGKIPGAWKRLSELERKGYVIRGASRECRITRAVAATWYAVQGGAL